MSLHHPIPKIRRGNFILTTFMSIEYRELPPNLDYSDCHTNENGTVCGQTRCYTKDSRPQIETQQGVRMDEKQFKLLMEELTKIRNLLILNASKAGATSSEISKILNTSDSRVRQILTATGGKKKKIASNTQEADN